MQPYEFIENFEQVIATFGMWPSFHDGEVLRIVLDRSPSSKVKTPSLEIAIRGWVMGPDLTSEGFTKQNHDSVVHFLFEDIFDLELEGFNVQNVLTSLKLSLIADPEGQPALNVELEHCYLFDGVFNARKARVVGIEPFLQSC